MRLADVRALSTFDEAPIPTLFLDTDLTIKAANRSYQRAVGRERDELLERPLFEVFPDNPEDPEADGTERLALSLDRVAATGRPHDMVIQRYDVFDAQLGQWTPRVWKPLNSPVHAGDDLVGLRHQVQDVTSVPEHLHRVLTEYREFLRETSPLASDGAIERITAILSQHDALVREVAGLRQALSSRAIIDQAKGIIMADRRCDAEQAFAILSQLSSRTNVRVADLATALVAQCSEPDR